MIIQTLRACWKRRWRQHSLFLIVEMQLNTTDGGDNFTVKSICGFRPHTLQVISAQYVVTLTLGFPVLFNDKLWGLAWNKKSLPSGDNHQSLRCLHLMVRLLPPEMSLSYKIEGGNLCGIVLAASPVQQHSYTIEKANTQLRCFHVLWFFLGGEAQRIYLLQYLSFESRTRVVHPDARYWILRSGVQ